MTWLIRWVRNELINYSDPLNLLLLSWVQFFQIVVELAWDTIAAEFVPGIRWALNQGWGEVQPVQAMVPRYRYSYLGVGQVQVQVQVHDFSKVPRYRYRYSWKYLGTGTGTLYVGVTKNQTCFQILIPGMYLSSYIYIYICIYISKFPINQNAIKWHSLSLCKALYSYVHLYIYSNQCKLMITCICINIGSGNGLVIIITRHQAIIWTDVDLSLVRSVDIHLRTISWDTFPSITNCNCILFSKFL